MFLFLGVLRRKFLSFSIKTNPARPENNVFIAINNFAQNLFMQAFAQAYHNKLLKDKEMEIICVDGKTERGTVLENGCKRYTRRSTHTRTARSWDTAKLGTGCQSPARQDQTAHEQGWRNLDTIHRIIYTVFSIWRRLRKKKADRRKGMAEIMRHIIPE